MTDAEVVAAIRANHLKANIGWIEAKGRRPIHPGNGRPIVIDWSRAWVDRGGTIFGVGPYLHVPILNHWGTDEETVHRVYPPARLQRKLAKAWAPPPAAEGETRCDLDPLQNVNEMGTGNLK